VLLCVVFAAAWAAALGWTWNRGAPGQPSSSGRHGLTLRAQLTCGAVCLGLMLWSVILPGSTPATGPLFGASVAYGMVLVLVLAQGRYLVRAPIEGLVATVMVGGLVVFEFTGKQDVVADIGRLVVAMCIGSIVARFIERLSWMAMVCVGSGLVDIWSVFSSSGTTNQLLHSTSGSGAVALSRLLLVAPNVAGQPLFDLGTTDVLFTALYLAFAHLWRLDMWKVCIALVVGFAVAFDVSYISRTGIPVLPFLGVAFLAVSWRQLLGDLWLLLAGESKKSGSDSADTPMKQRTPAQPVA
jgi:hypothetical protein